MKTKAFDYSKWPTFGYGRAHAPEQAGGQWTTWISAGGQHDAIVCHGMTKEDALALRRHLLAGIRAADPRLDRPIHDIDEQTETARLAAFKAEAYAHAAKRWCWTDVEFIEGEIDRHDEAGTVLVEPGQTINDAAVQFINGLADDYDLTDPEEIGYR